MSRLGIPLASPIFCGFFETIHDPLSALPCPLGPNVNRWAALKTSTEPTFPVFVTCAERVVNGLKKSAKNRGSQWYAQSAHCAHTGRVMGKCGFSGRS